MYSPPNFAYVSLLGKHCSQSALVNALAIPSEYALCTTLHSSELQRSAHSWGTLGLSPLGLCHIGCDRAPASLRLSLLRGSVRKVSSAFFQNAGRRLLPKMPSVRRWTGIVEATAALPSPFRQNHESRICFQFA
eukprot:scaffold165974_cov35-Tisochrysis_lutea.AAC.2